MKRYITFILLIVLTFNMSAQNEYRHMPKEKDRGRITTDMQGRIHYENRYGFKATLSDSFRGVLYQDNRNNEMLLSNEIFSKMFAYSADDDRISAMYWLINYFRDLQNEKASFKYGFHKELEYSVDNRVVASLQKDIFDNMVYKDNKRNQVTYSKEYWDVVLYESWDDDIEVFFKLKDRFAFIDNFTEEFKVDIFGYQQYRNSKRQSASLSKDIFDKMIYKDSEGNKIEYSPNEWKRIMQKYYNEQDAFLYLTERYLSE